MSRIVEKAVAAVPCPNNHHVKSAMTEMESLSKKLRYFECVQDDTETEVQCKTGGYICTTAFQRAKGDQVLSLPGLPRDDYGKGHFKHAVCPAAPVPSQSREQQQIAAAAAVASLGPLSFETDLRSRKRSASMDSADESVKTSKASGSDRSPSQTQSQGDL
ncbi:hypothetical protein B484DRAFT_429103 [Ochromonadaceae sp. CCMP2298]|nr:hypothetical protein B484DRAFT_429103 [Ochromonadaceae sp. CCMP2298]